MIIPALLVLVAAVWVARKALRFAPPTTIRIASGPEGSGYRNQAEKYKKIIEAYGVKVQVLPSKGALDNLQQLADRKSKVDVGFVQGGLSDGIDTTGLVSLGSVFAQPIMAYCRSDEPIEMLSQLKGKRIAVGPEGSGTRVLALKLLKINEMDGPPTQLQEMGGEEAAKALIAGDHRRRVPDGRVGDAAGDAQPARRARHRAGELPPGGRLPAQVPVPVQADAARRRDGPRQELSRRAP